MDAARFNHTKETDVQENGVAKLRLRACDGIAANTVVAQVLLKEAWRQTVTVVPPYMAIHQETVQAT